MAAVAAAATKMANVAGRRVRAGDLTLYLQSCGRPLDSVPPPRHRVLCIHGWMDNVGSFDTLLPLLPDENHYVSVDLPGHGASEHRPNHSYTFFEYVRDIHDVVTGLGWDRFCLLGHSMGAGIGALYAGTFPERVDRLILLEGGSPLTLDPAKAPDQLRDHILSTERMRGNSGSDSKVYATRADILRRLTERPLSEGAAECLLRRGAAPVGTELDQDGAGTGSSTADGAAVARGWRFTHDKYLRLPSPYRMTEAHVWAFHARVVAPTLMVTANAGYPFPATAVDALEAALREGNPHRVTRIAVPGAHHVHLETPEIVAPSIVDFLTA